MVTVAMSTRQLRKRRWQSSPGGVARTSLDFDHMTGTPPKRKKAVTPSPKKPATNSSKKLPTPSKKQATPSKKQAAPSKKQAAPSKKQATPSKKMSTPSKSTPSKKTRSLSSKKPTNKDVQRLLGDDEEAESLSTKSFYGKREKKSFPHSPKRRKAAEKILSKISDNSSDSDAGRKIKSPPYSSKFEFHATDSGDTDSDGKSKAVLKQKDQQQLMKKTTKARNSAGATSKPATPKTPLPRKTGAVIESSNDENLTPQSSGKKFFKNRSPASTDRCGTGKGSGSIVIRKGFDLKFVPRRLSDSAVGKSSSTKKKTKSVPKQPKVKKVRSTECVSDMDEVFFVPLDSDKDIQNNEEKQANDSAIDLAPSCNDSEVVDDIDDIGSESLFSEPLDMGRITPVCETPSSTSVSPSTSSMASDSTNSGPVFSTKQKADDRKLFPIFTGSSAPADANSKRKLRSSKGSPAASTLLRYTRSKDKTEQMIIDAGQKRFGATQCEVCGMVYTIGDPTDETTHSQFHQSLLNALKFPGWKKERVVQEYLDTGSRVVMVMANAPNYATRKVEEINKIMGQELGFPEPSLAFRENFKAFLYITGDNKIAGCCVAEPVSEGYTVLPESQSQTSESSQHHPGHRPWCCDSTPVKASVGVSRIWVHSQERQKGIATRLLDCVRQWFVYGSVISKTRLAFSDPTPDGKILATKYTGTQEFLVYKFS